MPLSVINKRRLYNFRQNRRGFWALWIFLVLYILSLGAEFIANDQPIAVRYDNAWYFPVFTNYSESTFGGDLEFDADYSDPYITDLIKEKGTLATSNPALASARIQALLGGDSGYGNFCASLLSIFLALYMTISQTIDANITML